MLCDSCRPQVPKECRRPVEDPEMLSTACSRECKNGHCTPTGKCCCSSGWDGPFCLRGTELIWAIYLCQSWSNFQPFLTASMFVIRSQMWTGLSQRRSLHGAQQVSLQGRFLWQPVRERRARDTRGRRERQHPRAHHWHDVLPAGPHQLYCIKSRAGW